MSGSRHRHTHTTHTSPATNRSAVSKNSDITTLPGPVEKWPLKWRGIQCAREGGVYKLVLHRGGGWSLMMQYKAICVGHVDWELNLCMQTAVNKLWFLFQKQKKNLSLVAFTSFRSLLFGILCRCSAVHMLVLLCIRCCIVCLLQAASICWALFERNSTYGISGWCQKLVSCAASKSPPSLLLDSSLECSLIKLDL